MGLWLILAIAGLLLAIMLMRERYVERVGPGLRPSFEGAEGAAWKSKIDAEAPIGGSDEDYLKALQKFYDDVYKVKRPEGSSTSPKDTDVQAFLDANTFPNVDNNSLRQIILSGFSIDKTGSAQAREEKQLNTQGALKGFQAEGGSEIIEPRDGVDEVYAHNTQEVYTPADTSIGNFPEGNYSQTNQTEPSREGVWDDKSTSWSPQAFYSVCEGGPCAQNVL